MINDDDDFGRHRSDPDANHTTGRSRHRADLADDFRRLDAAQRAAAAEAGPLGRALIEASRAATYDRLAPLVAEVDRTWTPGSVANTFADTVPNTPADRTLRFDRDTRPPTSAGTVPTITTDTDHTGAQLPTLLVERPGDRNRIVDIVVKAAQVVRHPRRRRQV